MLYFRFRGRSRHPSMHVTDAFKLLGRLTPELVAQQRVHAHPRLGRPQPRHAQRRLQHAVGLGDLVDDAVGQRLLARPAVRLQQHLARDLRAQLEARQRADAVEVQPQVHRRHREEAARAVHDAVVVGQRERARAAEGVAGQQRDRREWEVQHRGQQRVEAVAVAEGVRVRFVQLEALVWSQVGQIE